MVDHFTRTLTIHTATAGVVDEYGNPTVTDTDTAVVGHYRRLSAQELGDDVAGDAWRVYLPAGTSIAPADRITLDNGRTVEVIGLAAELYDPRRRLVVGIALRAEAAA